MSPTHVMNSEMRMARQYTRGRERRARVSGAGPPLGRVSASGGGTNEMYWDIAVLSTKAVVGVGYTQTGADQQPRVTLYSAAGALLFAGTRSTSGSDTLAACATDAFGGWYATATVHNTAVTTKTWVYRGSVMASAGVWASEYGAVPNTDYVARNIAVWDASCAVVGQAP